MQFSLSEEAQSFKAFRCCFSRHANLCGKPKSSNLRLHVQHRLPDFFLRVQLANPGGTFRQQHMLPL